ncbi:hypothetical protein [Halorussus salinisoli]|uniref:hypothetical protein n=1 Tax=Halorussus salinisoli TaxID=2558242 RepID=UPI0010C1F633|nr:hypothetical protein [Halorussus salinisoli]
MKREQTATDAEGESVRVWMVERTYARDEHNIVITYATPDGGRYLRTNRTKQVLVEPTTAAIDVTSDRLESVEDPEIRERYAAEVSRMADRHDPDDEV